MLRHIWFLIGHLISLTCFISGLVCFFTGNQEDFRWLMVFGFIVSVSADLSEVKWLLKKD